ncbi:MAG: apolipoprotein N-acyltransferase, partial [Verrucomicrobiaceae bacterium]
MHTEISASPNSPTRAVADSARASLLSRLWPWLAAVTSGVLLSLCFPGFNQGWLIWVALTPLICAVWLGGAKRGDGTRGSFPRPFALGYLTGFIFVGVTFRWLVELAPLFRTPWLQGLPILLAFYMALYPATWTWLLTKLPFGERPFRSPWRNLAIGVLGACIWTALEWTRGWLFSGWGWNGLGIALHEDLAMIQIADFAGVLGLTWLVAFCNLMAVIVVRRIVLEFGPQFMNGIRWEFSLTMALLALVFGYGVRTLFQGAGKTTPLQAVALQPNIPQTQKFDPDGEDEILRQLDKLTGAAALLHPPARLVVWPEAATPRGMFADEVNYRFVMDQAARGDFTLLLGTLDYELDPAAPESPRQYNAAMLLSEKGKTRSVYRKMHLVPFGEYLPLRQLLPQAIGDLVPGDLDAG